MSAQNKLQRIDIDLHRALQVSEANVEMLTTMHGALTRILHCEVSLDGGIAQRHIAETALVDVHKIANELEEKQCPN